MIALHAHDAGKAMRRLARHDIAAIGAAVEGGAEIGQGEDMGAGLIRYGGGDARLDRTRPGFDGVERMGLGAVGLRHRGGHAALRPSGTGP